MLLWSVPPPHATYAILRIATLALTKRLLQLKGCAPYAALRTGRAQKEAKAAPLLTLFAAGSRQAPLQSLPLHRPPTAALD